jgi:membrane protein YqaA with SNARE-associated domain
MAIVEQIRSMHVKEEQRTSAGRPATGFVWRFEYTLLIGVFLLLTAFAIGFFYFSADIESLKSYGYAGLFLINVIGAASILLPSPAGASVVAGGALLEDFLGVPAFIWVGLVAGLGEAIGEFSGYAAGYGGRFIIEERPAYHRIRAWMEKRGFITMFIMSTIPNPFFDVAGLAAGAVQMPLRSFFFAVLGGKVIKNTWLAAAGGVGAGVVAHLL